jgi:MbtH protein
MSEYAVVVNGEEQYSIWRAGLPVVAGWRTDGFAGSREDCLRHIAQVWPDARPRGQEGA